jgi:hypothetical protein
MSSSAAGVQKSLDKIRAQVEAGAYYEAQQMYKTVYHRYRARKALADSYEVLVQGAVQQLASKQVTCGIELGQLLVEAYKTDKAQASPETLGALQQIVQALPLLGTPSSSSSSSGDAADTAAQIDPCSSFVMAAMKWAYKQGAADAVRSMHTTFGLWLWRNWGWQVLGRASLHLCRGSDPAAFAAVLQQSMTLAAPSEQDLFIARAVLQTLASGHPDTKQQQLAHAQALLAALQQNQQQPAAGDKASLLIHFASFLLQALALGSQELVQLLGVKYASALERDPALGAYLEKVQQVRPSGGWMRWYRSALGPQGSWQGWGLVQLGMQGEGAGWSTGGTPAHRKDMQAAAGSASVAVQACTQPCACMQ